MTSFLILAYLLGADPQPAEWPQWHGSNRDSVANIRLDQLPKTPHARWRLPIGGGYGGVSVAGGRVYLMDRQSKPTEVERVLCIDADTGREVWVHSYPVTYGKLDYGNGPRATPTVHDGRVYTFGAVGHLHCLDAKTGKVIWSRDGVKDFSARVPMWGLASSPLIDAKRVIVQMGGEPDACYVALDAVSGKEVWRTLPDRPGYASAVAIETNRGRQLICWTAEHVAGVEPASGAVLWRVPHTTEYDVTISDPVWHASTLLVGDYWKGCLGIRLGADYRTPTTVWSGKRLSLLMSTPLIRGRHAYAIDRRDGLKCIDMASGTIKWEGVHVTPAGRNPQASLVWLADTDRALIFNEKGELILARLTPAKFTELGKIKVMAPPKPGDVIWAHPAYARGAIFARSDAELVCVPIVP